MRIFCTTCENGSEAKRLLQGCHAIPAYRDTLQPLGTRHDAVAVILGPLVSRDQGKVDDPAAMHSHEACTGRQAVICG